jgi:hypothetical protein
MNRKIHDLREVQADQRLIEQLLIQGMIDSKIYQKIKLSAARKNGKGEG